MTNIAILEDRLSFAKDLKIILEHEKKEANIDIFGSVDDAISAVDDGRQWDVWIVDLMMPPGNTISAEDAKNGLATGTIFIRLLVEKNALPTRKVVVVTSRSTDGDNFSEMGELVVEFQKSDITQVEIAKEVIKFIS